ncbi:MAG TPA: nitrilase-related carbon-nitrogen hydrolase, partial [Planctomycetota bacterium]|nr:nitrilase-related carbon-nitrogen hydrolase [Planctomycetota bacterium]
GDPAANGREILAWARRAADRGACLAVFPELALTGYTCEDLFRSDALLERTREALAALARDTAALPLTLVVGGPLPTPDGRLFNAAFVLHRGRVRGAVPKTHLPNYGEFYERRWFASGRGVDLALDGFRLSARQVFEIGALRFAVEICEDLWAPIPPSSRHAVAGATVILNPSASNDLVGKAQYRRELVIQQSGRTLAAYVYANTGVHESTTDLVFGGHLLIAENGVLLAEGERFKRDGELVATDVDVERLRVERARQTSFADAVHGSVPAYRTVSLAPMPAADPHRLVRRIEPHPFVPYEPQTLDERCREVFQVQTAGLARRLEHVGVKRVLLGLSGGLDSTLALLVCARTFDLLGLPRAGILAVTM